MHKIADPRVDVCLYFISPHRIKSADVDFMTKLSKVVPVLPILAKVIQSPHLPGINPCQALLPRSG